MMVRFFLLLLLTGLTAGVSAAETVDNQTDSIVQQKSANDADRAKQKPGTNGVIVLQATFVGDKEQPKVMSIVPWQAPPKAGDMYLPIDRLIQKRINRLERSEFLREIDYHQKVSGQNPDSGVEIEPK